ncbi:MAG: transposase [Defluviitaleaceae bacterium]|nr:transposase [Defluviitaleaceae bacterium]
MVKYNPNSEAAEYFNTVENPLHRQYLAMRMFFADGATAEEVAAQYGYTVSTVYSYARNFKEKLGFGDPFFKEPQLGRKKIDHGGEINDLVVAYRKRNFSVPEIKTALDAQNITVSERYISLLLAEEGFARLPRRDIKERNKVNDLPKTYHALVSERFSPEPDKFSSQLAGLLLFLPIIKNYGIDRLIEFSDYPESKVINRLSSILSFLALKLSDVERYSMDDAWCMDRGMGLFAGLNVLPKTAWFSSYSSGITRQMNIAFLDNLRQLWNNCGLLSDTANLDFTAIPYWGDDDPFENNWSGKRSKALASIQAVLAQDPDSGIIFYGDTTVRHKNESNVILEFLDFYHHDTTKDSGLKYLVFDSKFTTYENLNKLNTQGLKFITIQRRCQSLETKIKNIPGERWKNIKIVRSNGKGRNITVCEDTTTLAGYKGSVRQVFIAPKGRTKPAIIITNDFNIKLETLVRKYGKRWLVEKNISEQIHFFHLNRNCSGIVVKVDFDLVMTILAHNLYRLFVQDIEGYSHCESKTIFNKFISNPGEIVVSDNEICIKLKKKRTLPLILEQVAEYAPIPYQWLCNKTLEIIASTTT